MPNWLRTTILCVVSVVWVGNFILPLAIPGFESSTAVNFVFASFVGGALTIPAKGGTSRIGAVVKALSGHPEPPPPPTAPQAPEAPLAPEEGQR